MSNADRPYDASKDQTLSVVKVKNDKEGYSLEVKSYDGHEPRVAITRFYVDGEGKWKKETKTKYPRMSMRLIRWIIENGTSLERGFKEWKAPAKRNEEADEF